MTTVELSSILSSASSSDNNVISLLTAVGGELKKANLRAVENFVFSSVNNAEDLDNPTTRGVFNITPTTPITRPSSGTGWDYGYVLNLAVSTGIQLWMNFQGYIAVRGKKSTTTPWEPWYVMQQL